MSELKPCEAIEILESIYPSKKQIVTGEYPEVAEALDMAIAALRRAQPANEPLTLEQLREAKDGAPLWMAYEDGAYGEWGLVCYNRDSFTVVGLHEHHKPDDYGKTWLAYRRPLERSKDNA